ncbi:protein TRANSPARENT TESTA GLABRA 1 [Iris pallida]|uniref:Protein TRANSPARENT TESTA GLABRA 1 n=1 Tax=Iris pallida TaxID=29817 RepID=A0AAX6G5R4_IRIPA|nr:protein TRANSPARENT TESTA GLABRA 1 [Iris pallida]
MDLVSRASLRIPTAASTLRSAPPYSGTTVGKNSDACVSPDPASKGPTNQSSSRLLCRAAASKRRTPLAEPKQRAEPDDFLVGKSPPYPPRAGSSSTDHGESPFLKLSLSLNN